jgi:hypothetical protein
VTERTVWLLRIVPLAMLMCGASSSPAAADTYGFSCITANTPGDCSILQAQLQLEVTAGSFNQVEFKFINSGPANSSITDVYFDDLLPPVLGTPVTITDSGAGVSFKTGCSPKSLPGGNAYSFSTSYCADSSSPTQPMGVNPGEWLKVAYTLQGGSTFAQVIAALNSGAYRVGIHVQGFATGGSESGINVPPPPQVPEPLTLTLLAIGAITAASRRTLLQL